MMDGVGVHEVVIGSPVHNQLFPLMEDKQVEEVLLAYRERYLSLREDPRIKLIIIFKNHGEAAGTSLEPLWSPPTFEKNWRRPPDIMTTTAGVSIVI